MPQIRFNVFGQVLSVQRAGEAWRVFAVGADGKLGPAGVEIPDFIAEDELGQYLADLFHEEARPGVGDVHRLP